MKLCFKIMNRSVQSFRVSFSFNTTIQLIIIYNIIRRTKCDYDINNNNMQYTLEPQNNKGPYVVTTYHTHNTS